MDYLTIAQGLRDDAIEARRKRKGLERLAGYDRFLLGAQGACQVSSPMVRS
jgi:hypothetical protein